MFSTSRRFAPGVSLAGGPVPVTARGTGTARRRPAVPSILVLVLEPEVKPNEEAKEIAGKLGQDHPDTFKHRSTRSFAGLRGFFRRSADVKVRQFAQRRLHQSDPPPDRFLIRNI
jgi:hypothetical protein